MQHCLLQGCFPARRVLLPSPIPGSKIASMTKDAAQAPCFSYGVKLQGKRVLLSIRLHLRKY